MCHPAHLQLLLCNQVHLALLSCHLQAIVDDISCVILHTCGLPPPERDSSVPRPLARAASCNDEANELYWKASV